MNGIGLDWELHGQIGMVSQEGASVVQILRTTAPQFKPFGCFSANCCRRIAMLAAIQ